MELELLKKFVSLPSIFPYEDKLASFIENWVKSNIERDISDQKVDKNRRNLIITKGKGKKTILLSGHLDTVPASEGWIHPYKPIVNKGRLYGLGSWDMKAGLAVILQTLKEFEPKNISLKVAFTVDEENYSVGVHKLIDTGYCDDVDFVLVSEPGFIHGEKGISVGRSGRATYVVEIKGNSAHGSYPEEGDNAIEQATEFINQIKDLKLSINKELGSSALFPRMIKSEAKGFSVPDSCIVELDSTLVYPDKPDDILKKLKEISNKLYKRKILAHQPKVTFKTRPTPFCSPYKIDKNNEYVKICEKSVEQIAGKAILFYRNSVADECIFADRLNVPVVTIGPAGENAHRVNEYVELNSLTRTKEIYLKILENMDTLD